MLQFKAKKNYPTHDWTKNETHKKIITSNNQMLSTE